MLALADCSVPGQQGEAVLNLLGEAEEVLSQAVSDVVLGERTIVGKEPTQHGKELRGALDPLAEFTCPVQRNPHLRSRVTPRHCPGGAQLRLQGQLQPVPLGRWRQGLQQREGPVQMGNRLRVGGGTCSLLGREMQVVDRLLGEASFLEMPGELDCDLAGLVAVQRLEHLADVLVQIDTLRCIKAVVEVLLKQIVTEAVGREALAAEASDTL